MDVEGLRSFSDFINTCLLAIPSCLQPIHLLLCSLQSCAVTKGNLKDTKQNKVSSVLKQLYTERQTRGLSAYYVKTHISSIKMPKINENVTGRKKGICLKEIDTCMRIHPTCLHDDNFTKETKSEGQVNTAETTQNSMSETTTAVSLRTIS